MKSFIMLMISLLTFLILELVTSKKSSVRNKSRNKHKKKKQYDNMIRYDLEQIGSTHNGNYQGVSLARSSADASQCRKIDDNHPFIKVL